MQTAHRRQLPRNCLFAGYVSCGLCLPLARETFSRAFSFLFHVGLGQTMAEMHRVISLLNPVSLMGKMERGGVTLLKEHERY